MDVKTIKYAGKEGIKQLYRRVKALLVPVYAELDGKADRGEVAEELEAKADKSYVDTELSGKADVSYVDSELDSKADKSYVDDGLSAKADADYVDAALDAKADTSYVDSGLAGKTDKVPGAGGHLTSLDEAGNLVDSGVSASMIVEDDNYRHISVTGTSVTDGENVFNKYVHPISEEASPAAVKVGRDSLGHTLIGPALTKGDVGLGLVRNATITVTGTSVGDGEYTFEHPTVEPEEPAAVKVGMTDWGHVVIGDALAKSDVGLGNVDNTADADKPISDATQAALDGKQDTLPAPEAGKILMADSEGFTWGDKSDLALDRVNNTSDAEKPISTATQAALDTKQDVIDDLDTIRSGASAGATAVQPGDLADYALKSEMSVVAGSGADADKTTITLKDNTSATVLTQHQDISGKVDKVEGKGLSTEDYTAADKTKLGEIAPGAQVNVIETVKVNGSALPVSNKAVDVSVPTVNDASLTINQNNELKGTFTANSASDVTLNLTDTTYESKAASQGGNDVSLVTTGEKYAWNAKQQAAPDDAFYVCRGSTWVKVYDLVTTVIDGYPVSDPDMYEKIGSFNGNLYRYVQITVAGSATVGLYNYDTLDYDDELELTDETRVVHLSAGGSFEVHAKGADGVVTVIVSADTFEEVDDDEQ